MTLWNVGLFYSPSKITFNSTQLYIEDKKKGVTKKLRGWPCPSQLTKMAFSENCWVTAVVIKEKRYLSFQF